MGKEVKTTDYLSLGEKLSVKEKSSFGFGVLANTLIVGTLNMCLMDYYITYVMIEYPLFILANIIFLIYNAINDVIFGHYSDYSNHKLGRRIPFIRYGAPLFAIAFILFWFPFPGTAYGDLYTGQLFKFVQLLTAYLFYDTALTMVILSMTALPPEMSESTKERASISLYRTIAQVFGGILMIISPSLLESNRELFRVYIIIISLIAMVSYIILSYGVKERKELYKEDKKEKRPPLINGMLDTFKNKAFISFLLYNFCAVFLGTMISNYSPFVEQIKTLPISTIMIFYMGVIVSIPIYLYFSRRVDTKKIIQIITLVCLVGISSMILIDFLLDTTEVYWIIFIFDGALMGIGNIILYPYISDTIDVEELESGERREGMYFGMNALITKPSEQLPAIIGAFVLWQTNFNRDPLATSQPPEAIFGLKFLVAGIPLILCIIMVLSQLINPLEGEYYKSVKERIVKLHKQKKNLEG
ncbi:MAG: MFS transporter [archaeon]|nr:MFS transporter [archaeon]